MFKLSGDKTDYAHLHKMFIFGISAYTDMMYFNMYDVVDDVNVCYLFSLKINFIFSGPLSKPSHLSPGNKQCPGINMVTYNVLIMHIRTS